MCLAGVHGSAHVFQVWQRAWQGLLVRRPGDDAVRHVPGRGCLSAGQGMMQCGMLQLHTVAVLDDVVLYQGCIIRVCVGTDAGRHCLELGSNHTHTHTTVEPVVYMAPSHMHSAPSGMAGGINLPTAPVSAASS